MIRPAVRVLLGLAMASCVAISGPRGAATEQQELVDRAKATIESLKSDPNFAQFRDLLDHAKAVVVMPQLYRGGFIVGAEGGAGVLLARDARTWSYPAFFDLGSASIGLQIGAEVSEVVLLVMTEKGFERLLEDRVTLGGDVSIAVGPVGAGLEARTTTSADADVYAFARAQGLFGGFALKGGALSPNEATTREYYGRSITAREIVVDRKSSNPGAEGLREALPRT
jgi:lipid-binding SYLF domain-containing protein